MAERLIPGDGIFVEPDTSAEYLMPGNGIFSHIAVTGVLLIAQARSAARFVFSRLFSRIN